MSGPASDELIKAIEQVIKDAESTYTCSRKTANYAALIARIRQQDETINRMQAALVFYECDCDCASVDECPNTYTTENEWCGFAARAALKGGQS